jgi:hypothetical protein
VKLSYRALVSATLVGTILELIMVTTGHTNLEVRGIYPVAGMGISGIAGILYTVISTEVITRDNVIGGAIAGAISALIGIAVSVGMGDVVPLVLVVGTASSAVTGAVGGWLGRLFSSGRV